MDTPRFPPPGDAAGFALFGREMYAAMFRHVLVHVWNPTIQTLSQNIYGEDLKGSWPKSQIYETPCYFAQLPGWKAGLTKQGIDEVRPLIGCFNQSLLNAAKQPFPKIGDLIELVIGINKDAVGADSENLGTSDFYKVMQENPTDYFANLSVDQTYTWTVKLVKYRYEAVSRGDTDEKPLDPLYRDEGGG